MTPRIIIIQHGFRHRYMLGRIFEQAGWLERLYTDTTAHSVVGKLIGRLLGKQFLLKRDPRDIPRTKVFSHDLALFARFVPKFAQRPFGLHSPCDLQHRLLSSRMKKWGLGDANWVYTMFDESLPFVRYAKASGARVALDVFVSPLAHRLVETEIARFGLARPADLPWNVAGYEADLREILALADLLLCPSEWVLEGVRALMPEAVGKAKIVPYGITLQTGPIVNVPEPGRIFFCGRDSVRKGLHTLAAAASEARKHCPHIRVRVAGRVRPQLARHIGWNELEFLGELNCAQMAEEYRKADAFVLPTLAEGLAGVVVEALGAGVPVVTTRCAGVKIDPGENGLLVEPDDVPGLAAAIAAVVKDRRLRDKLSQGAQLLATEYTTEAWQHRLVTCLQAAEAEQGLRSPSCLAIR
jgi:glycosyltransferase involved in cell wall biosynthesis